MFRTFCRSFSSYLQPSSIFHILKTKNVNEEVIITGWIKSLRKMKGNAFFDINDGSSSENLQVVFSNSQNLDGLSAGASVIAKGQLTVSPKGQLELSAENVEICGKCVVTDGYPFSPKKTYTPEYTRQHLHFRPRISTHAALLRVRDSATRAIHDFFGDNQYVHIHTPVLTSNDCEGAGEVFTVCPDNEDTLKSMTKSKQSSNEIYFNSKVYLTVSAQLHLEAVAHSLNKVYTFGPTFRAENSKSRLHLSEFYMLEAELAFVDKLEQVLSVVENLLKTVGKRVLDKCEEDVVKCTETQTDHSWLDKKFIILSYDEAVTILNQNKGKYKYDFLENHGFVKEHEHFLVEYCNGVPIFIVDWPKQLKPFYMRDCEKDPSKVAAFDLLVPCVGELVGGSLRENNYETLKQKLPQGRTDLDWYLDIRKFGGVPTGGFGLGFERFLQFLLGIGNIKDTIPFPRWPHNCQL